MKKGFIVTSVVLLTITLLCFRLVFTGKVPVPADTIIGLYHPFRDLYAKEYPRGIPFKNPLIGDSVSQQIPWRTLSFDQMSTLEFPLWNPYAMAGYPLLGNIQSAPFYPLNVVFLFLPFLSGWTILIMLQPLLGGLFMMLYLRNLKLHSVASLFGGITFGFSGFFLAWLEWGTIAQTALWFPLAFLAVDKIVTKEKTKLYGFIFFFAFLSAFLAGHLQTFIYGSVIVALYVLLRMWSAKDRRSSIFVIGAAFLAFVILLFPVWFPQVQLILLSARNVDLSWMDAGWFIPREHIIQFIAPDFFGNPATGNYFGVWNYGEFLGYVGIVPLFFALVGIARKNKTSLFFAGLVIISLLLAVKSPLAKLPYIAELPLFSSTQPTRLLFITDLALAVLAAFGLDRLIKEKKLSLLYPLALILGLGGVILFGYFAAAQWGIILPENWKVTQKNLILPTILTLFTIIIFLMWRFFNNSLIRKSILFGLIIVTAFDLLFIANKYNSFSKPEYFFPQTKAISFLQNQPGEFRIMTTDRIILHPNFQVMYKLQSINGYDPLYLNRYGELIAAMGRRKPDISTPFGFSRIVTPEAFDTRIIDLLGVRYVLSKKDLSDEKLVKVYQEGETQIYQNLNAFPRVFFVQNIILAKNKQDAINKLFDEKLDLRLTAIIENDNKKMSLVKTDFSIFGTATIKEYTPNNVTIETENGGEGFLVFTDSYYPTWHAYIDGKEVSILRTDYNFRGVVVPQGKHTVQFSNRLISL